MKYAETKQKIEIMIRDAYWAGLTPVAEDLETALESLEYAHTNNLIR
jgi:hypothetical protein